MPFEKGGLADKLGNRYEGHWIAVQLLALLEEKIQSVTVEAIGDDEQGVELWVQHKNGDREAYQCKARNASREYWTVGDLAAKGILKNLQFQLNRDPKHKFVFVSSVGSEVFKDICDFSRRSGDDSKSFYENKILSAGQEVRSSFETICRSLSLDPQNQHELDQIYTYIRRTYVQVYPDDRGAFQHLLERVDYLLVGQSQELILSALLAYVQNKDKFGTPIYVDELRNYLSTLGIHPKSFGYDPRIAPAIENLQNEFAESIRPLLINGTLLKRQETGQIIKALEEGVNVILTGSAGYGKSSVLFEILDFLSTRNIPYLPIRLDRRSPQNTADQFGKDIGLTACPVYSLVGFAGDRQCVLILDQLDAIRWTSIHSNNALEVCKELVRHVQFLRREGKNVSVVLSCRSFDLQHDPSLRNWLENNKEAEFTKIEVKELSAEKLKEVIGASFDGLTGKEKSLLACPHNLAIWTKLKSQKGSVPSFQTSVGLMQEFWKDCRSRLDREAKINPNDLDNVLTTLVDYAERNGKISIPERIVSDRPTIVEALCSYSILQKAGGVISFGHQRYLDYLIAERLLRQIDAGNSILEWLGTRDKQSLFRREQLRQALVIIADESSELFLKTSGGILRSTDVRFHIKHLVLEVIGVQELVTDELGEFCLEFFKDTFWQQHIVGAVYRGHPSHINFLVKKGVISGWLNSNVLDEENRALWLLQSVADLMPDLVTNALEPYIERDLDWQQRILKMICWRVADDSERMFELRLRLARLGVAADFVDWKSVCSKYPLRSLKLIEAFISSWDIGDEPASGKRTRMEKWYDQDEKILESAVEHSPLETWNYFIPHVTRLTTVTNESNADHLKEWRPDRIERHRHEIPIEKGIVNLVIKASHCLAQTDPDFLVKEARALEAYSSPVLEEILMEVYTALPPTHADIGVQWLLADVSRFRTDYVYGEEWKPAMRLIKALSPHCSDTVFKALERSILTYHSPDERRHAQYYLTSSRNGHYGHFWGEAQFFFLPVLDSKRIEESTSDLIRVLQRKFYPEDRYFHPFRMSGGMVGSKLDPSLEKISDRSWLVIVKNTKLKEENHSKWIQVDPDHVLASSVQQFSESLQRIAKRFPERFGKLALSFPEDVHPSYVSAILYGCTPKSPDANIPDAEKANWKPASIETIEALLNKFKGADDRNSASSFCRLILSRPDEKWSDAAIQRLISYATSHPDLEPGKLNVRYADERKNDTVDSLFQNSINCVRGVAAEAIAALLWKNENWFNKLRPAIESLISDAHPSVRMASLEVLLPVINFNKDQAVKWFVKACEDDLRVAACRHARHFVNYTIKTHFNDLAPIIRQMIKSPLGEVAEQGAAEVAARWLFYDFFESEVNSCLLGDVHQKKGLADTASRLFDEDKYTVKCQYILKTLMNDPDKEVRKETDGFFHNLKSFQDESWKPFIVEYIHSRAFADNSDRFVYHLKDVEGSLIFLSDIIFPMYEVLIKTSKNTEESHFSYMVSESLPTLVRLYEQATAANNVVIVKGCLDTWDALYENRVGIVGQLSKAMEQD